MDADYRPDVVGPILRHRFHFDARDDGWTKVVLHP
jgi:hypothetical protein